MRSLLASVCATALLAGALVSAWEPRGSAWPSPSGPPPPSGNLTQYYSSLMNHSCAEVVSSMPTLPSGPSATFMSAYQAFNGTGSEAGVISAAKVLLAEDGVQPFLSRPWAGDALDSAMVLCAVIRDATPAGLAAFAGNGSSELALVTSLLNDTLLMRDMLLGGGPSRGDRDGTGPAEYGPAMQILDSIYQASKVLPHVPIAPPTPWDDRNQSTMLHRMALGIALGHAVPVPLRWPLPSNPNVKTVDPLERYLHFEALYLAGDLDPASEVLTAFEQRWAANGDASEADIDWLRLTMRNFRPENIAMTSYSWRFAESVHTDVAYGDPACEQLPGICDGTYSQIPAAGGECGPRAFFGRYTRKSMGLPTWGQTQPGHAAMSTWTPGGWQVLLGADWEFGWWGSRSGPDFYLETQCRELRSSYEQVLRGTWAARALDEQPAGENWTPRVPSSYGQGGLWSALMLYAKKIAVNETVPPVRPIGPSQVPTYVDALLAKWQQPLPAENITTDADGNIIIPATAFFWKNHSASLSPMWAGDEGTQVKIGAGSYPDPPSTSFSYAIDVKQATTMYLTANHTTWHMNTDLLLVSNTSSNPTEVGVYDTVGWWNLTQPVPVSLLEGTNVLTFMRSTPADIVVREFKLWASKPDIPPPDKNHSSKPVPPPSDYILESDMTTCIKQGITNVPEQDCQRACEAVGMKFTGNKARMNVTDCFVCVDGEWKGNCGFNTNSSATMCNDPPCTVFGSHVAQICVRS